MSEAEPPPLSIRGPVTTRARTALISRPVLAALTVVALAGICAIVPGLERYALLSERASASEPPVARGSEAPKLEVGQAEIDLETTTRDELALPEQVELPKQRRGPIASKSNAPLPEIDFEKPPVPLRNGDALAGFYRALAATARDDAGAITRIVHFGDSIVTSDYVSATLRRRFQKQFGDAGHGFMLMANAWPAYFHNDVYRFASKGWKVSRIVGPLAPDGLYGLGGVSFVAPPGSRARFGTAEKGNYGRKVSRFTVVYLERPGGGKMRLNLDGTEHEVIDTAGEEPVVRYHEVKVPDGEHRLEVVTIKGSVRAFGVVMERTEPGVVYDAIGIQGARVRFLDKQDDAHWAATLKWRKPNLLIYQFGANESGDGFAYSMKDYNRTMKAVLRQGLEAVPEAGCLVLAAMDRAEKKGTSLSTMPVIPAIVKEQKAAAAEVGCAFWNTFEAMGGPGSMAGWVGRGLGQADLTHPTGSGSELLGRWVYRALMQGYESWRAQQK